MGALQKGLIVLPKSAHADRIAANANVFDFALTDEHMLLMEAFDEDL